MILIHSLTRMDHFEEFIQITVERTLVNWKKANLRLVTFETNTNHLIRFVFYCILSIVNIVFLP